jgi:L-iditol 2-dehydrogenase
MDALLLTDYMRLELVRMPVPEPGPEDVLVRVRACGICGSDVHGLDGSTGRRIPPLVMGTKPPAKSPRPAPASAAGACGSG